MLLIKGGFKMSRGGFPGGFGGGFGGMNINQLMRQAKKTQENLTSKEFEGTAGGEAVYVKVNGAKQVIDIKIKKEVVDPDDVEMLQDLILTAINDAMKKVDEETNAEFGKYNIPGL